MRTTSVGERGVLGRPIHFGLSLLSGLLAMVLCAEEAPPPLVVDGAAILVDWVQPAYPDAARQDKAEGRAVVEFVVGLDGTVSQAKCVQSTAGYFEEPALAAVRQWKFKPALENGQPVESAMSAPVVFELKQLKQKRVPIAPPQAQMPHPVRLVPAKAKVAPDPDYPDELQERKLPGQVMLEFVVQTDGHAGTPLVKWASHAAFVETALRAVEHSEFEPAHQGAVRKTSTLRYPVDFQSFGARRPDILAANHLKLLEGTTSEVLPEPFVLPEPVYPLEKLLVAEEGSATAEFLIQEGGEVREVKVTAASAPEFGAALQAAVETWMFRPAMQGGARMPVRMRVTQTFAVPTQGTLPGLLAALRPGGAGVEPARGLDGQLRPLWRGFPAYPRTLLDQGAPSGAAEIEFIIDEGGRARLPRVVSCTAPEFGWAAATAISQWVFVRPMRAGAPVAVRVSISVNFTPPKA